MGWLPRGFVSTDSLKDIVRRTVPTQWVDHPSFWAVACDYSSGKRTVFGRPGTPKAELADAVAASCAIPGFYRPVSVGGRLYVDGGVRSASNLDLLARRNLDLVICLNPTSTLEGGAPGANLLDRFLDLNRAASGRRLGSEAKRVRAGGTRVVLIQPTTEDLAVIGRNLMSGRRRNEVIETAMRTVAEAVREPSVAELLAGLPEGEPHKIARPPGPPDEWPELVPAGRRRHGARRLRIQRRRARRTARRRSGRLPGRWRRDREERATGVARRATALSRNGTSANGASHRDEPPGLPRAGRRLGADRPRDGRGHAPDPGAGAQGRPRRARPRLHPRLAAAAVAAGQPVVPRRGARASSGSRPRARCCWWATTRAAT